MRHLLNATQQPRIHVGQQVPIFDCTYNYFELLRDRSEKYRCSSGKCIDEWRVCDGTAQCDDNGDESEKECSNFPCPTFTYKCKYGACVRGDARCNGVRDCFDGSDEAGCNGSSVTEKPDVTTTKPTTSHEITPVTQPTTTAAPLP